MTTRYSGIVGVRRSSAVLKRARDQCFPEACLEGEGLSAYFPQSLASACCPRSCMK